MSTSYHVYMGSNGDPVDYSTVIATTSSLTWPSAALAYPGSYIFAVRAFDTVTGYEELNVDCRARLILDSSGANITARPNAPFNVSAITTAGGGVNILWMYSPLGQGGAPTAFDVWITAGSTPGYSGSPTTAPYSAGTSHFSASISGLTDGVTYTASVRATNAVATEPNVTAFATFVADSTPPAVVDGLTATVGIEGP